MGYCENTLYAEKLLCDHGIKVDYYTDSSPRIQGRKLARGEEGQTILSPYPLFKQDVYFILTTPSKWIDCARLQLMTHNIENYSIFLTWEFDYADKNPELQNRIMESINEIAYEGETPERAMPFVAISNRNGKDATLGNLTTLVQSLRCSQWVYPWEDQLMKNSNIERVLEVGPGFGLMSLVLLKGFPNISIDWMMYGDKHWELEEIASMANVFENGLWKIKKKYGNRINAKYGYIEREDFPFDTKYDLIIMTEVIEHFALNPINTMKKIKNMLKPDGKMILTTPNWGHLHIYETWREMPDAKDVDDERYMKLCQCGHSYQYSKGELSEIFDLAGFQVDQYAVTVSDHQSFVLSIKD